MNAPKMRFLCLADDAELLESRKEPTSIIKFETDDPSKAVKISHVEIVEVDDTRRRSSVFFYPEAEIIDPWMKADEEALGKVYKSKKKPKTGNKPFKTTNINVHLQIFS